MFVSKLKLLKRKINKALKTENEFSKRIHARHTAFWKVPNKEAVLYRKMYAEDPITEWRDVENWQRKLSNKHNSREFAKMHGCKVPDLYWQGRDYKTIDFDALPHQYVIRPITGYSAKMVFLMHGAINQFDGRSYTKDDITSEMSRALSQNPNLEFLIEEFVTNEKGEYKIPDDYKLYMFNGEVACIQVINRLSPGKGSTRFYDENWNLMETVQSGYTKGEYQAAPVCLNELINAAKKLSKAYQIFVRIDFYATQKGAVFGEFTPTPFFGDGFTTFGNKLFISKWDKYCKNLI